jgi:hypothetical protein
MKQKNVPVTEKITKVWERTGDKSPNELIKEMAEIEKPYKPKENIDTLCSPNDRKIIETAHDVADKILKKKNCLYDCTFASIAQEITDLHDKKNHDYGDAAYQSYLDFGLISYVIRLGDKYNRLKSLTKPGATMEVKEESIVDTLKDLAAYSIMAIEALRRENLNK